MKVAITGVSGYLGGVIARSLAADPGVEAILGLDVVPPRHATAKATFQEADVRRADFATLLAGIDVLYHLAFVVDPPRKLSMEVIESINVNGSRRVFEGALAAGVPKIVYASSAAAYGAHWDNPVPMVEESPLRPNGDWYYSRTKGEVERMLDELQARHPAAVIVRFRPSVVLGPGVANTIGQSFTRRVVFCTDPGLRLDLVWDEDVAEAFRLALRHDRSDVFNLTGGAPLTAPEMGALLGRRVVRVPRALLLPCCRLLAWSGLLGRGKLEWVEVAFGGPILVSAERARVRLGWKPRYDAAGTLRRFAAERPPA